MKYFLKAGEERTYQITDHNLRDTGFVTFTIDDVNEDKPIQWSVIGARKSELITSQNKKYAKSCRVYVMEDQWTPADGVSTNRVVNVSAICTETGAGKVQTEMKAKLTVTITPDDSVADFFISNIEAPEHVSVKNNVTTPAKVTIKTHLSPEDVNPVDLSGYITVDFTGRHHASIVPMTPDPLNDHILEADIEDSIVKAFADIGNREFIECNYTVDVFRAHEEVLPDHHHTSGGKIIVTKAP